MNKLILATVLGTFAVTAVPVAAKDNGHGNGKAKGHAYGHGHKKVKYVDFDRRRDDRREYRATARSDWRSYNRYDYNRVDPRFGGYYADRYYRDASYYQPRQLSYNDRVYRGQDGRFYCRRSDGTTGLIVGAALGGLIGNSLDRGRSSLLGTLLGAGIGGAVCTAIDRNVTCR